MWAAHQGATVGGCCAHVQRERVGQGGGMLGAFGRRAEQWRDHRDAVGVTSAAQRAGGGWWGAWAHSGGRWWCAGGGGGAARRDRTPVRRWAVASPTEFADIRVYFEKSKKGDKAVPVLRALLHSIEDVKKAVVHYATLHKYAKFPDHLRFDIVEKATQVEVTEVSPEGNYEVLPWKGDL